ncbi:MAG: hypothetical protein IPK00_16490 [Deltaproteobacteria bacterium]|nr:hypothetical protein [Deltaproteobacteria bacterium]
MTMRVQLESGGIDTIRAETVILPCLRRGETPRDLPRGLASLDRRLAGRLTDALASGDFKANAGDRLVVYGPRGGDWVRCILLGLGEAASLDDAALRELGGHVGREFKRSSTHRIALVIPPISELAGERATALIAEGALLGAYRFDRYLSGKNGDAKGGARKPRRSKAAPRLDLVHVRPPRSLPTLRRKVTEAALVAECQAVARDLSNEPPNVIYPDSLAREARRIAREVGLRCRVLDVPAMTRLGMGAILAVGQGSAHPPRMIILEHEPRSRGAKSGAKGRGARTETLALVGKGITFDSGGLSLKTATGMPDMKHDMSGAAAVLGAMRAIALLELPIRVVGVLAAAENMPSANAYRPSDIIRSASGQTIEIVNTDAGPPRHRGLRHDVEPDAAPHRRRDRRRGPPDDGMGAEPIALEDGPANTGRGRANTGNGGGRGRAARARAHSRNHPLHPSTTRKTGTILCAASTNHSPPTRPRRARHERWNRARIAARQLEQALEQ